MALAKLSCGHSDQLRDRLDTEGSTKELYTLITKSPTATLVSVKNNGKPSMGELPPILLGGLGMGIGVADMVARHPSSSEAQGPYDERHSGSSHRRGGVKCEL